MRDDRQPDRDVPIPGRDLDLLFSGRPVILHDATWNRDVTAESRELGTVVLRGLLVGDPFSAGMTEIEWPGVGSMPTTATARAVVVDCRDSGDRVASLAVVFDAELTVANWVRCNAGVETDCCIGGFASAAIQGALDEEQTNERLLAEYENKDGWNGLILSRDNQSVVLASSGWGDGAYDAWWGLSSTGVPICVAIDFDVLSEDVFTEANVSLPLKGRLVKLPALPGVTLKAGLLKRTQPKVVTKRLPQGHSVYTRVFDSDGAMKAPKVTYDSSGGYSIDLRPFNKATSLIVRLVTGHRPMEIVSS